MDNSILKLEEVSISFGGLQAVNRCSFEMGEGGFFQPCEKALSEGSGAWGTRYTREMEDFPGDDTRQT